jgi:hypothetical protein
MDSWNDKQIQKMRVGGNDKLNDFLQQYGIPKTMPIPQKYNTPAASLYRDRVDAAANGRPLPTELPTSPASGNMSGAGSTHTSTGSLSSRYAALACCGANSPLVTSNLLSDPVYSSVAQGTDPLPGESEAAYVARQRLLQEEARERMRQKFGTSNGLRSGGGGGGMAGIGSDPNYRPGQGSGRSSGTPDLNEIGANAFSFVSSWADTISKVHTCRPCVFCLVFLRWWAGPDVVTVCVRRRRSSWCRRRRPTREAGPAAPTAARTGALARPPRHSSSSSSSSSSRTLTPGPPSPQVRTLYFVVRCGLFITGELVTL